jgi:hypothetical protein
VLERRIFRLVSSIILEIKAHLATFSTKASNVWASKPV